MTSEEFRSANFSRTPRKLSKDSGSGFRNRTHSIASSSGSDSGARPVQSTLYKTELCRSYEETGSCRYGKKCQFAHSKKEIRVLHRHPKYKTELCKSFHSSGYCPYGARCHFIHRSGEDFFEAALDCLQAKNEKSARKRRNNSDANPDFHVPSSFTDEGEIEEISKNLGTFTVGSDQEWAATCFEPAKSNDSPWTHSFTNIHDVEPQKNFFNKTIGSNSPFEISSWNSDPASGMSFSAPFVSRNGMSSTGVSSGSDRDSLSASPDSHPIFVPRIPAPNLPKWDTMPAPKWDLPKWDTPVADLEPEENRLPIFRSLSISEPSK